jgi:hypothetical protein
MRWLNLIFLYLGFAAQANAAHIAFVGLGNSATPEVPGTSYSGVTTYGGGVLLEMRMMPFVGLELGGLYAPRKFSYSTSSTQYTLSYKAYEFPVLLRFHLARFFSVAGGAYYSKASGGMSQTSTTNGVTTSQGVSFTSQNQTNTDYGAVVSAALTMKIAPLTRFLIDGRYLMGTKNDSLSGGNMKFNDMELLAGLQFGF